jgi:hypothetical protein
LCQRDEGVSGGGLQLPYVAVGEGAQERTGGALPVVVTVPVLLGLAPAAVRIWLRRAG